MTIKLNDHVACKDASLFCRWILVDLRYQDTLFFADFKEFWQLSVNILYPDAKPRLAAAREAEHIWIVSEVKTLEQPLREIQREALHIKLVVLLLRAYYRIKGLPPAVSENPDLNIAAGLRLTDHLRELGDITHTRPTVPYNHITLL